MAHARRIVALLVLAVVLCTALTPGASGRVCAILVPLLSFAVALALTPLRHESADGRLQASAFFPVLAPRAPPAA